MSKSTDAQYVEEQYGERKNIDARVALHRSYSTSPVEFHRWVFERLALPEGADILEVGCGTAELWAKNRERIPRGWRMVFSDRFAGMVEATRKVIGKIELGTAPGFAQCDVQALPFLNGQFDAVLANHMLYHVPNLPRALGELRRVLAQGGRLFATTVGQAHMRELDELIVQCGGGVVSFAGGFNLENGEASLAQFFDPVRRSDFEDSLRVTEVEPLVAYALSGMRAEELGRDGRMVELRRIAAERIARAGAFTIHKAQGLFEATKR